MRQRLFAEHPFCVACLAQGLTVPATIRDHILNLQAGGTDTDDNVQPLCVACHDIKTDAERRPEIRNPRNYTEVNSGQRNRMAREVTGPEGGSNPGN
jgi:5-methylcytosine-specific restriction protein A